MVPYSHGLYVNYKDICGRYSVQVHFKGGNTLKNLLMFPKDSKAITKQINIICWFKHHRTECDDECIGESARTFEERYKEHLKSASPIFKHQNITGHTTSVENIKKIWGREGQIWPGPSKKPYTSEWTTLHSTETLGKYNLPHIWNKVLFVIPELKTK